MSHAPLATEWITLSGGYRFWLSVNVVGGPGVKWRCARPR